jgi:hypothetical protein
MFLEIPMGIYTVPFIFLITDEQISEESTQKLKHQDLGKSVPQTPSYSPVIFSAVGLEGDLQQNSAGTDYGVYVKCKVNKAQEK